MGKDIGFKILKVSFGYAYKDGAKEITSSRVKIHISNNQYVKESSANNNRQFGR